MQNLNQSDEDYSYKSTQIKNMIDDLVTMRLGLLTELKTIYKSAQKDTSSGRNNLANQLTVNKIIENEKNIEQEIDRLEKNELNKKRLVELGEYEYDRHLIKIFTNNCLWCYVCYVKVLFMSKFVYTFIRRIIILIIAFVLITIGRRMMVNTEET